MPQTLLKQIEEIDLPADERAGDACARTVRLAGTDLSFEVDPEESILAAALRANIHLAHDCKSGTCATCRCRIVEGSVGYDDLPMGLDPEDEEQGFALACQGHPESDVVLEAEVWPSLMAEPERHTATVRGVEPLSADVTRLVLALPEAAAQSYRPGQYIKIHLGDGAVRSFSMASPPNGETVDFHVRRIDGGRFTGAQLKSLAPGDELHVEMPHGAFFLRAEDFRPLLMLATGTGLAPIKAILESLHGDPDCPPVTLYWGARTEEDLYLDAEIRSWADRFDDFTYVPVLSRPGEGWTGRRGYVQEAAAEDFEDFSEHALYLCGSPNMVRDARARFLERGGSANHVYADSFLFQHNLAGG